MSPAFGDVRSLYLHIPFCERKCEYCDFTSVAGATGSVAYMNALNAEVRHLGERLGRLSLDTVFIGGGTPSLVDPDLLAGLVATVHNTFSVAAGRRGHHGGQPVEHHRGAGAGLEGRGGQPRSASGCRASRPTPCGSSAGFTTPTEPWPPSRRCATRASRRSTATSSTRFPVSVTFAGGGPSSAWRRPAPRTSRATS